jgi:hypothetical protein
MSEIRVDTISEKTSANGVAIDSVTLKDGGIAATAASTITTSDNATQLTLKSTDADAAVGPVLTLHRESSSPADDDIIGRINFIGEDSGGTDTTYGRIETVIMQESNGSEDATMEFRIMKGGTERNILELDRSAVIINEDSQDIDFRVESNGNSSMLHVDAGNDRVGIGTSSPQTTLHLEATAPILRISDSNSTSEDDAVGKIQFYDRNNTDLNAEIISGTGSLSDLILSAHNNRAVVLQTNGNTERLRVTGDGKLATGGETAPDNGGGGLTLNQGATDAYILTFKNTDLAQDTTGIAEADTYGAFEQANDTNGGLGIRGFAAAGTLGLDLMGYYETTNTSKATNANVPVRVVARLNDGTSFTAPSNGSANANVFGVSDSNSMRFIVDSEGDLHRDNTGDTAYDTYDDAQLMRALDLTKGKQLKGFINSKFDEYVKYNHEDLAQAGLVGREDDGTPNNFINITGFQRLHHGAIWQQYEKHQKLAEAVYEMAKEALGEDKADAILEKHDIKLLN